MQIQKCNSERFISSSITLRQWTMDCPHFTSWPIRKKRRGCNSANYINTVLLWFIRVCVRSGCSVWKYKITHPTTWCSCEFDLNYFLKGHRGAFTFTPLCLWINWLPGLSVCLTQTAGLLWGLGAGPGEGFILGWKWITNELNSEQNPSLKGKMNF